MVLLVSALREKGKILSFIHPFICFFLFFVMKLGTSTERRKQMPSLVSVAVKGQKRDEATRVYSDTQTAV